VGGVIFLNNFEYSSEIEHFARNCNLGLKEMALLEIFSWEKTLINQKNVFLHSSRGALERPMSAKNNLF
jgi:hypothetical protein